MPKKLLLADDSITIQKVIEIILAQEDFEIKAVSDGEEALKLLSTFMPDIVLADVAMPMIDGYQLCERIRGNPALAHVPVVLLAGAFEPYDEERAKSVGASGVLIKPFESKELIGKVKSALAEREEAGSAISEAVSPLPEKEEPILKETTVEAAGPGVAPAVESLQSLIQRESAGRREPAPASPVGETAIAEREEIKKDIIEEAPLPDVGAVVSETPEETRVPHEPAEREPAAQTIAPEKHEIIEAIERTVDRRLGEIIDRQVLPDITAAVKESLAAKISARLPSLMEGIARDVVAELTAAMRPEIENQMKRAVPEVAEALIRKEIEKITSEG